MAGRTAGLVQSTSGRAGDHCVFGSRHPRPNPVRRLTTADAAPQSRSTLLQERSKAAKAQKDDASSISLPDTNTSADEEPRTPSSNPVVKFWSGYVDRVETDPVPTKAATSFLGFVIGDLLAQRIEGHSYNLFRTLRLGTYGLTLDGPVGHWWYTVLDRVVEPQNPRGTKAVVIKTAADQLIWAPVMTCVFFAVLKSLEGHPELIWPTIQDKLVKTVAANYVIWPAAHFINFRFVPTEQRILYNNCVSVAWTAYLSTLSHVPIVDVENLGNQFAETQSQLFDSLPPELQNQAAQAARAAQGALRALPALPSLDSLLQPGEHFGLDLSIPKKIEIRSTRAVPGSFVLHILAKMFARP